MKHSWLFLSLLMLPLAIFAEGASGVCPTRAAGDSMPLVGEWRLLPYTTAMGDAECCVTSGRLVFKDGNACEATYYVTLKRADSMSPVFFRCTIPGTGTYSLSDGCLEVDLSRVEASFEFGKEGAAFDSALPSGPDLPQQLVSALFEDIKDVLALQFSQVDFTNVSVAPTRILATLAGCDVVLKRLE